LVFLFFLDLNIIFNLSHLSNHSQTLTNFTLNPPSFTVNRLKVHNTNSHSNPLEFIISLSLQLTLTKREGKADENSFIFQSSLICNGLRVISRLQLCPQFIFQLNYESDVKIWLLKLLLQQ